MFKNVVTALAESRDITLYLSPLMKHFLQFEETDFSESKPLLKPLMHVVSLVSVDYDNFQRMILCSSLHRTHRRLISKGQKILISSVSK